VNFSCTSCASTTLTTVNSGLITLAANLGNGCTAEASSQITVGTPLPTITITGVAPYGAVTARVTTSAPAPYTWYVDGVLKTTTYVSNVTCPIGTCGYHNLSVGVVGTFGPARSEITPESYFDWPCTNVAFAVSPNPADNAITITTLSGNGGGGTTAPSANTKMATDIGSPAVTATGSSTGFGSAGGSAGASGGHFIQQIILMDAGGRRIQTVKYGALTTQATINVKSLPAGIYFATIIDADNTTETERVIVQH